MTPLREYIEIADVKNKLFKRAPEPEKQDYIDQANKECEDLAKRRGVAREDISAETHFKLEEYLVNYATSKYGKDRIGSNAKGGLNQGEDVYKELFTVSSFIIQNLKPDIVKVVFTGEEETPINRAVFSQQLHFG